MGNYFENLDEKIKKYFSILSEEIPEFLEEYIQTPVMQKQNNRYMNWMSAQNPTMQKPTIIFL